MKIFKQLRYQQNVYILLGLIIILTLATFAGPKARVIHLRPHPAKKIRIYTPTDSGYRGI